MSNSLSLLELIQSVEAAAKELESAQRSRELSLVITKLQEARLWEAERLSKLEQN